MSTDNFLGLAIANNRAAHAAVRSADINYENYISWKKHAKELEAQLAALKDELAVEKAHSAGLEAQTMAFAKECPNCNLMADSGKRYKDGDIKRKARLIYEAAFDATAKKLGISNPASRRAD